MKPHNLTRSAKKNLGLNIESSKNYGHNKIIIFPIYRVVNLDTLIIHSSITFGRRINVLTQGFFFAGLI